MCTELMWFKSSYSDGEGAACVEVADGRGMVHVRDSKVAGGPELALGASSWRGFVAFARTQI
ncbi:DUF397 domain-containing protein [Streptomyces bambusae]|uniref:DUF397 domain-containing protein n=1 Tax=Streptomyces bambusae TaxID=1550616 RepID=A0ABS6Z4B7_9ACTN|nr:DUF397 domain-containing protein [Streptomyces bambusae]MBW5482579.1 DUF397 domain-containing protein [Streptomyces bambusae]